MLTNDMLAQISCQDDTHLCLPVHGVLNEIHLRKNEQPAHLSSLQVSFSWPIHQIGTDRPGMMSWQQKSHSICQPCIVHFVRCDKQLMSCHVV